MKNKYYSKIFTEKRAQIWKRLIVTWSPWKAISYCWFKDYYYSIYEIIKFIIISKSIKNHLSKFLWWNFIIFIILSIRILSSFLLLYQQHFGWFILQLCCLHLCCYINNILADSSFSFFVFIFIAISTTFWLIHPSACLHLCCYVNNILADSSYSFLVFIFVAISTTFWLIHLSAFLSSSLLLYQQHFFWFILQLFCLHLYCNINNILADSSFSFFVFIFVAISTTFWLIHPSAFLSSSLLQYQQYFGWFILQLFCLHLCCYINNILADSSFSFFVFIFIAISTTFWLIHPAAFLSSSLLQYQQHFGWYILQLFCLHLYCNINNILADSSFSFFVFIFIAISTTFWLIHPAAFLSSSLLQYQQHFGWYILQLFCLHLYCNINNILADSSFSFFVFIFIAISTTFWLIHPAACLHLCCYVNNILADSSNSFFVFIFVNINNILADSSFSFFVFIFIAISTTFWLIHPAAFLSSSLLQYQQHFGWYILQLFWLHLYCNINNILADSSFSFFVFIFIAISTTFWLIHPAAFLSSSLLQYQQHFGWYILQLFCLHLYCNINNILADSSFSFFVFIFIAISTTFWLIHPAACLHLCCYVNNILADSSYSFFVFIFVNINNILADSSFSFFVFIFVAISTTFWLIHPSDFLSSSLLQYQQHFGWFILQLFCLHLYCNINNILADTSFSLSSSLLLCQQYFGWFILQLFCLHLCCYINNILADSSFSFFVFIFIAISTTFWLIHPAAFLSSSLLQYQQHFGWYILQLFWLHLYCNINNILADSSFSFFVFIFIAISTTFWLIHPAACLHLCCYVNNILADSSYSFFVFIFVNINNILADSSFSFFVFIFVAISTTFWLIHPSAFLSSSLLQYQQHFGWYILQLFCLHLYCNINNILADSSFSFFVFIFIAISTIFWLIHPSAFLSSSLLQYQQHFGWYILQLVFIFVAMSTIFWLIHPSAFLSSSLLLYQQHFGWFILQLFCLHLYSNINNILADTSFSLSSSLLLCQQYFGWFILQLFCLHLYCNINNILADSSFSFFVFIFIAISTTFWLIHPSACLHLCCYVNNILADSSFSFFVFIFVAISTTFWLIHPSAFLSSSLLQYQQHFGWFILQLFCLHLYCNINNILADTSFSLSSSLLLYQQHFDWFILQLFCLHLCCYINNILADSSFSFFVFIFIAISTTFWLIHPSACLHLCCYVNNILADSSYSFFVFIFVNINNILADSSFSFFVSIFVAISTTFWLIHPSDFLSSSLLQYQQHFGWFILQLFCLHLYCYINNILADSSFSFFVFIFVAISTTFWLIHPSAFLSSSLLLYQQHFGWFIFQLFCLHLCCYINNILVDSSFSFFVFIFVAISTTFWLIHPSAFLSSSLLQYQQHFGWFILQLVFIFVAMSTIFWLIHPSAFLSSSLLQYQKYFGWFILQLFCLHLYCNINNILADSSCSFFVFIFIAISITFWLIHPSAFLSSSLLLYQQHFGWFILQLFCLHLYCNINNILADTSFSFFVAISTTFWLIHPSAFLSSSLLQYQQHFGWYIL